MKRCFDLVAGLCLSFVLLVPMALVALAVRFTSCGPILYWSDRVGRHNALFSMPKFRTMRIGTPEVAAHLLNDPRVWMTPIGAFLRSTSLDELPQLWSILKGDMSFVGPRPALFNQHDLIEERTRHGVHTLVPGLTGWAQINGRDELTIVDKTAYDLWYAEHRTWLLDLMIILKTALKTIHVPAHHRPAASAERKKAA